MADGLTAAGAAKDPSRSAPLNMSTYISGLITQQNPMAGGAVPFIQQKFYSATRYDRLIGGVNCELSVRLSMVRAPGSSLYNSATFARPNRWCSFKPIVNGIEQVHVMVDTPTKVYDGTGPSGQLNIWNKSAGAGKTQFQPVGDELFFGNGIDQKKWVLSQLIWQANTLYDGSATSDTTLGDFIIDTNGNIQQAVGGFNLLISNVAIAGNVLTLTLDTSQLQDPTGTPTGTASTTGGTLPAGANYIRIAAVDPTGNVTEAGNESASVATTGSTSEIAWSWPAVAGAVSYRIYVGTTPGGETTYFTSTTNSFTQTAQTGLAAGTPPVSNGTSLDVPANLYAMVGVKLALSGFTAATFLNGQTVTITGTQPNGQATMTITANFTHANYASTADTGQATSGTGITGSTQPTWVKQLAGVTQDGGAQWINRSSNVQNWGIAAPTNAPTIYQSAAPTTYPSWQPNTTYWPSCCVYSTNATPTGIFQLTTSGGTGSSVPTWNNGAIGDTTTDGTAVWTYRGAYGWNAATAYAKGAFATNTAGYVYEAQNAGTSGANQLGWATGAGAVVQDGSIVWLCLGLIYAYETGDPYNSGWFGPNRSVSASNTIQDTNGYLQTVQDPTLQINIVPGPFVSGVLQPTWGATGQYTADSLVASITGFSINVSLIANIVCANVFSPGLQVTITGMTVGTYLNGFWTVQSTDFSAFQFLQTHGTVGSTSDSGLATVSEPTMWLNTGTAAPKSTTGRYYAYSYANSVTGHIGTASPQSALIKLLAGNYANVQGFGSADPQVDTIIIWQTADGGTTLLEADRIANPGGGVPFTYNDSIADTALNFESLAPIAGANNPPPAGFLPSAYHLGRIWGFVGNKLIYSGGPDTINGSGNEAFPPGNFFFMPESLTKCRATSIGLLIYGTANVYVETGLGTAASPFIPPPTFQEGVGLLSYDAECVNGSTAYLMTSSNRVISFDPGAGEVEIGFFIGDQFDANFDPSTAYLTFHEGSSEDMALYVADGSTGWFRMGILGAPESGNVWSLFREIVGGCGAIQSVEVTPGQKLLLIGANTSGPILQRDYSVYTDNGTPYPMYLDIGSILLCQPGTEAEVEWVTLDSLLIGTRPTVGILLGELSGQSTSPPWTTLVSTARDLPLLPAPKTLYSDRYHMAQNQNQQSCRHMQLRIQWAAEAIANELLTHTVYGTLRPEAK